MAKIKTRDAVKGTIKTLDKATIASQRMKEAYVHTKDKAEHATQSEESSAEEYAANKTQEKMGEALSKGAYIADKVGRKNFEITKDNFSKAKDSIPDVKVEIAKVKENFKTNRAAQSLKKQHTYAQNTNKTIKTIEHSEKSIRESVTSAGNKSIKLATKESAKTVGKTVKTAEQTAKASIKTSQQVAKATKRGAEATVKTAQKAAQATKEVAKVTAHSIKVAVKATLAAIKAIIAGTKALISALIAGGWISVALIVIVVLFGCAFSLFGGGSDSTSYIPVSAEVEAYDPLIRTYAQEHGIPEYVELIKAVMMQESGGRGNDPMQASESGYNTQYPRTPNGITNPEYSVNIGIKSLASCINEADVESPIDMEHIKLALQGYNYGNGYISWAKSRYGGYSIANAMEFSNMKAQEMGWDSYGDKQYVSHVLRYYPFGRAFTSGDNQMIVEIALSQEGNVGGEPYWSWYGFNSRVEWCACFVSWCANEGGYIESGVIPKFARCVDGSQWFKNNNQWTDRSYEPSAGDIIFFDWENDGTTDHVGIVEKCENGVVYTVEGNSGDMCRARQYSVGSSVIYGYGIPAY